MTLRYGTVCSGISCESVAWAPLGWQPVFFSEVEPFPAAVLAARYPDVPNVGDMCAIDGRDYRGRIDLLAGGTCCQSFSVSGKRGSLSDPRGNLALVYARIVHDSDAAFSIWENVPGILSTHDNAFGIFLAALVDGEGEIENPTGRRQWPRAGLAAGRRRIAVWRVINAKFFGVPQQRRRVFVFSVRLGVRIHPAQVLFELEGMPGDPASIQDAGADTPRPSGAGTGEPDRPDGDLTPLCMATGQAGAEIGHGECPTLSCNHEAPILAMQEAMCLQGSMIGRSDSAGPQGSGIKRDTSFTLNATDRHAVAMVHWAQGGGDVESGVSGTLRANAESNYQFLRQGQAVRRLTPRETERLQGLPDDYTLIKFGRGLRGADLKEMAAYWGMSLKDARGMVGDSHRYKAVGNGIAVPVIRWIGERLALALKMGNLARKGEKTRA
jgi:DNA (cytosine-5)-methyltransferase 1